MVNEYFIGREISTLNADKFTIEHIEEPMIQEDRDVMEKKFWDYKLWHPMVATMYFVHRYHTIAAKIIEREVGEPEAKRYRQRTSTYDLRKQTLAVQRGFWKARQLADGIGCTYDVYIRAAIRAFRANIKAMATWKANHNQRMPYPNQLSMTFMIPEAIKDWTEDKKARFPMPQHEGIPHNMDLWFRPEMEAWIREEAKRTTNAKYYIDKATAAGIIVAEASQSMML